MNKSPNGIQWYRQLKDFCKEDVCFLVTDQELSRLFVSADHPIDKYRGEHYMKINVIKTEIGYQVGRGKKNIIAHKSLVDLFNTLLISEAISKNSIVRWDFSERKAYKEKAKMRRKEKHEEYENIISQRMKDPIYAQKVECAKRRESWIKKTKEDNEKKSTESERILYKSALKRFGKRVKMQHEITVNGHIYFLDFYIKSLRVAIEVDGGYHSTTEQSIKDRERDANLASVGIKTIRIKNEQVSEESCIKELLDILQNRKKKNGKILDVSIETYFIGSDK